MKTPAWLLLFLLPAWLQADDFRTTNGQEIHGAQISRVELDGLVLTTDSGVVKLLFRDLPKEVQTFYGYDPAKVAAASKAKSDRATTTAQQANAVRIEGTILRVLPEGILVVVPRQPASGGGGSATQPQRPEPVYGKFLITGHPRTNDLAEDEEIDIDGMLGGVSKYQDSTGTEHTVRHVTVLRAYR